MDRKPLGRIRAVCLLILGLSTLLMAGMQITAYLTGQEAPTLGVRLCGIGILLCLPALAAATAAGLRGGK